MSNIQEQVASDIKEAMKSRDPAALLALRGLKAAFMVAAEAKGLGPQGILETTDAMAVVRKQIKQRQDSIESFKDRPDLAAKEEAELAILKKYLPASLTDAEIEALVDSVITELGATGKQQMGQVMKALQDRAAGRADGKSLSQAVAKRLG